MGDEEVLLNYSFNKQYKLAYNLGVLKSENDLTGNKVKEILRTLVLIS